MKSTISYNFNQHNLERLFEICTVSGQLFSVESDAMDKETLNYLRKIYGATSDEKIRCELTQISFYDLFEQRKPRFESVEACRQAALKAKENKVPELYLDDAGSKILKVAFERLALPPVWIGEILKTAQAIAQLDNSEDIRTEHIAEAVQYYSWDRNEQ